MHRTTEPGAKSAAYLAETGESSRDDDSYFARSL